MYIGSYTIMAKPMKSLELHYPLVQLLMKKNIVLIKNIHLLKTDLRISDFQHFHWLAGHRLSAHIHALPYSPMAPMFETRFLRLVHLCEVFENRSIRLSNDLNDFYETTDHLQQFKADKFSTFFKNEPLNYVLLV